jgi:diadenosine tetraphosphate (Ap4A) HIT family hydrolase
MFNINSKLEQDSIFICDLTLSQLRLMNDSNYLWLLLIPKQESLTEIIDLSFSQQTILLQEINLISNIIKQNFICKKLNIANLGNIVSQLHIHIIARHDNDPSFPKPIWGYAKTMPYKRDQIIDICDKIKKYLQTFYSELDKKIIYRSLHRGCKETDFLLGNFFQQNYIDSLNIQEKAICIEFLNEDDMLIYDWIINKILTPNIYQFLVLKIQKFHNINY